MSELEQAEARLAQLQGWLEAKIATRHSVALRDVLTTAIEVGRLRALAELEARRSRRLTWGEAERVESALAALAAREEVQG